jgi:hypothetical protein
MHNNEAYEEESDVKTQEHSAKGKFYPFSNFSLRELNKLIEDSRKDYTKKQTTKNERKT